MKKNSSPNPEEVPCNVFVDKGRVLFVTHQITHVLVVDESGNPNTWGPYWNAALAVGAFSSPPVELGEEGSSIWAFIDEDDNLLAIDMPNPRENDTGAPKEEILSVLRQILDEDTIAEIIETVSPVCSPTRTALLTGQSHHGSDPQTDSSNTVTIKVEAGNTVEDFLSQLFEAAEEAGAVTEEVLQKPKTRGMFFRKKT
tara:strand:- start:185 stop:781 length:597 start_codon:yes stop_codon:yes gene_type:complete